MTLLLFTSYTGDDMQLAQCVLCFDEACIGRKCICKTRSAESSQSCSASQNMDIIYDDMRKFLGRLHETVKDFHKRLTVMMEGSSIQQSR